MQAGTVVICDYINFKGENKRGLFCVLYDEYCDSLVDGNMNFTAIKITTQLDMIGNYVVYLDNNENSFLNNSCLASCSKIHTLHKHQIKHTLGKLSTNSFKKVFITTSKFLNEINRQMVNNV